MAVTPLEDGYMLLTGLVMNQVALHGVLKQLRDLGLPLLSLDTEEIDDTHQENQEQ